MYKRPLIDPGQFGLESAGPHQQWWVEFSDVMVQALDRAWHIPNSNEVLYRRPVPRPNTPKEYLAWLQDEGLACGAKPREDDERLARVAVLVDRTPVHHGTYITRDETEIKRVQL